jgi:hypothetical protein
MGPGFIVVEPAAFCGGDVDEAFVVVLVSEIATPPPT